MQGPNIDVSQLGRDPFQQFTGQPGPLVPPVTPVGGPTLAPPQGFEGATPPPTSPPNTYNASDPNAYWRNLQVGDTVDMGAYKDAFGQAPHDDPNQHYRPDVGLATGVGPDGQPLTGDYYSRMAGATGGNADALRAQATQWNADQMAALPGATPQAADSDPFGRFDDPANPKHGVITPAYEAQLAAGATPDTPPPVAADPGATATTDPFAAFQQPQAPAFQTPGQPPTIRPAPPLTPPPGAITAYA